MAIARVRRTKIVCTLGPAVDSREKVAALIQAGMNVARINCSHGDWETRRKWIGWVRELSPVVGGVAVLVDLQGPKFRIGAIEGILDVKPGFELVLGPNDADIPLTQPEVLASLTTNSRLLLGDGNVSLRVLDRNGERIRARAITGGMVTSRQGVTVVGKTFDVPAISAKDRTDLVEACRVGADFIALSYVKSGEDIAELRQLVNEHDPSVHLVAKVEMRQALRHLEDIVHQADAVMVARGDLGLQMDLEEVPMAQKEIIRVCQRRGKPVITATQMLESMISAPRPTRAEASDVANAILDGTDAVMLSGETAAGAYPIEACSAMARICARTDQEVDSGPLLREYSGRARKGQTSATEAVAHAVAEIARTLRPKAIVTTTSSGQTPRLVSKFRPSTPILCASWRPKTRLQMALVWGVEAVDVALPTTTDEIVDHAMHAFLAAKRLKIGDSVVLSAGVPAGEPGNTNLILIRPVTASHEG